MSSRKADKDQLEKTSPLNGSLQEDTSSDSWTTTKTELYSFYAYYVGNNGLSGFNPSLYGKRERYFAIQAGKPNITIAFTLVAVAVSFGWLGVIDPSKWKIGVGLYVVGYSDIIPTASLTFWTAAFPGLARNLPEAFESLQRNRISNVSFAVSSVGEILVLVVMVGILKGIKSDESVKNNTKAFSVLIAFSGAIWRFWQTYVALRECFKLKQTFLYLCFYFIMGDCLNTSVLLLTGRSTVIGTLQNRRREYSEHFPTGKYSGVAKCQCSIFWMMLGFNVLWIILLQVWGLIGVNQSIRFGFKNVWEIWQVRDNDASAFVTKQILKVQILQHYMDFWFVRVGKTSAFIGPFVSSAIIQDAHGNNNTPFIFLLAMGLLSCVLLYFVDVDKSRKECEAFTAAEAKHQVFA
ncbi:vacuole effluxer Atg22 like-domain-containing protein [Hysterangium stoloniferum]|nr:vacuole effluxer Atg22 like-domain-containing protein [Hysterangium stoloniferum]